MSKEVRRSIRLAVLGFLLPMVWGAVMLTISSSQAEEDVVPICPEIGEPEDEITCRDENGKVKSTKKCKRKWGVGKAYDPDKDGKQDDLFGGVLDEEGNQYECWCLQKSAKHPQAIYYRFVTFDETESWFGGCFFPKGGNEIGHEGEVNKATEKVKKLKKVKQGNYSGPPGTPGPIKHYHFIMINDGSKKGKCQRIYTEGHWNGQNYVTTTKEVGEPEDCPKTPQDVQPPTKKKEGGGGEIPPPAGSGVMIPQVVLVATTSTAPNYKYKMINPVGNFLGTGYGGIEKQIKAGDSVTLWAANVTSASVTGSAATAQYGSWSVSEQTLTYVTFTALQDATFPVEVPIGDLNITSAAPLGRIGWAYTGLEIGRKAVVRGPGGNPIASAPTNLVATPWDRAIKLTWNHTPGPNHLGYKVYRSTNIAVTPVVWELLNWESPAFNKSYVDLAVQCPGPVTYHYEVVSFDVYGSSDPSNVVSSSYSCAKFRRGDSNDDALIDISDCTTIWNWLFNGGPAPPCMESADTNDSGGVDTSDGTYLCDWLFRGSGLPPPAPGPYNCGSDPTTSVNWLGCQAYTHCTW